MSTSQQSHWFFDTIQQEIFICVLLRPHTNRWGLTSAEWQIPTPPPPPPPPPSLCCGLPRENKRFSLVSIRKKNGVQLSLTQCVHHYSVCQVCCSTNLRNWLQAAYVERFISFKRNAPIKDSVGSNRRSWYCSKHPISKSYRGCFI